MSENLKEKLTDLLSLFYREEIDQDEAVDKICEFLLSEPEVEKWLKNR